MDRMTRRADFHSSKANRIMTRTRATAGHKRAALGRKLGKTIGQDWEWDDCFEDDCEDWNEETADGEEGAEEEECDWENEDCSSYSETLILGIIDGVTGVFAT